VSFGGIAMSIEGVGGDVDCAEYGDSEERDPKLEAREKPQCFRKEIRHLKHHMPSKHFDKQLYHVFRAKIEMVRYREAMWDVVNNGDCKVKAMQHLKKAHKYRDKALKVYKERIKYGETPPDVDLKESWPKVYKEDRGYLNRWHTDDLNRNAWSRMRSK
jgi:hypothetical protein